MCSGPTRRAASSSAVLSGIARETTTCASSLNSSAPARTFYGRSSTGRSANGTTPVFM